MSPALCCLHEVPISVHAQPDHLVDVVAVHGLSADPATTWTSPRSGANWLQEFLPQQIHVARVLTYSYTSSLQLFFGPDSSTLLQRTAETFAQELYADRKLAQALHRPIIFVCHGLGGIIVKKLLSYSATRTAQKVDHLFDSYVSTFAILFFGTPHDRTRKSNWTRTSGSDQDSKLPRADRAVPNSEDLHSFHAVTAEFAPHLNAFHLFFFWEELQTSFGHYVDYIVDNDTAVVPLDNTEKAGIASTHDDLARFDYIDSSSYRTVIEALSRYCEKAPTVIAYRWKQADTKLRQLRANEAFELGGIIFNIHESRTSSAQQVSPNSGPKHFDLPVAAIDNFVGRQQMMQLLYKSFFCGSKGSSLSGRKSFVIHGMGGSGKTQLSSKFAQEYQSHYTAIFTIHAASPKTIEDSYCRIATAGGHHHTVNAGKHYLSLLEVPWLLIIDNADNPKMDLEPLIPSGYNAGHTLITTRNPKFRRFSSLGNLDLEGLEEPEALRLLLSRAEIPEPWDEPTRNDGYLIARSLGYLALALSHAGRCICQQVCTLANYLTVHSATRSEIQRRTSSPRRDSFAFEDEEEDEMVGVVYSTFDISYDFLLNKKTSRSIDAIEILRMSSFYHFERIPETIFLRAATNRRKAVGGNSRSHLMTWLLYFRITEPPCKLPKFLEDEDDQFNESRVTWALDELQSHSLITRDAREGTFSLHPLVHAWARDTISGTDRTDWISRGFNTLLESVILPEPGFKDGQGEAKDNGSFHDGLLPHLDACIHEHGSLFQSSRVVKKGLALYFSILLRPGLPGIIQTELENAGKCALVYGERGHFEKAANILGEVKDILIHLLGDSHERTLNVMIYLSNLYWGLGRLEEAIKLQQSVVAARRAHLGPEDEQTLTAMSLLGRSYWLNGQYRESLDTLEHATDQMKVRLGESYPQTLTALDDYGVTLGSWHRFEESRQIHQRVLDIRRKSLRPSHSDTLTTMMYLAMAKLDLGEINSADSLMTTVYEKRQIQLGKEHPWTLWALCYLAKVYLEKGSLADAEKMLLWGIEAGKRSLNPHHLGVLMGQGELSRVYARQGRLEDAEKLALETLKRLERSRGVYHPDCAYACWKLANLYQRMEAPDKTNIFCRRAIEKAEQRIGKDHPLAIMAQRLLDDTEQAYEAKVGSAIEHLTLRRRPIRHQATW